MSEREPCNSKRYPECKPLMFHHGKLSETTVTLKPNSTEVTNYDYTGAGPADPVTRVPYARPATQHDGCSDDVVCGGPGDGLPFCGPQVVTNVFGDDYLFDFAAFRPFKCMKYGFKNVMGRRFWHGYQAGGFRGENYFGSSTTVVDDDHPFTALTSYVFSTPYRTPAQNKYCSLAATASHASIAGTGAGCEGEVSCSYSRSIIISVSPSTGIKTVSSTSTYDPCDGSHCHSIFADPAVLFAQINASYNDWTSGLRARFAFDAGLYTVSEYGDNFFTYTDNSNGLVAYHAEWDLSAGTFAYDIYSVLSSSCDDTGTGSWGVAESLRVSIGETSFSFVLTNTDDGGAQRVDTVTATLSDANNGPDLVDDIYTMLAYWDLTDDLLYPWRTDAFTKRAPLLTRDEVPDAVGILATDTFEVVDPDDTTQIKDVNCVSPGGDGYIPTYAKIPWVDPNTGLYSGDIVGLPIMPGGKYPNRYWDGTHENDVFCEGGDFYYVQSYGTWNVDDSMPATATQWTKLTEEITPRIPAGATLFGPHIEQDGAIIEVMKYAEIKQPIYSHNYFRPCGADRFIFDNSNTQCIKSVTGSGDPGDPYVVTLENGLTGIATNDLCRTRGDHDLVPAGVWKVTKNADDQYELTTLMFDVPSNADDFVLGSTTFATADMFGKLRFPLAWPIEGVSAVVSVIADPDNPATKTIVRCNPVPWLRDGDHVDFSGVPLSNNLAVEVIDDTHFRVTATASGAYTSGGTVKSHGAPSKDWFDRKPKGDFLAFIWRHNFRDFVFDSGIRANQNANGMPQSVDLFEVKEDCVPFSACEPMVICFSPNGERFPNGVTYPLPGGSSGWDSKSSSAIGAAGALLMDALYGARWQALILTQMVDPMNTTSSTFLPPPMPCVAGDTWTGGERIDEHHVSWSEDDGSCADDIYIGGDDGCTGDIACKAFYPNRPYVEAMATVPDGAPALPGDIVINYLSLSDLDTTGDLPPGHIITPPSPGTGGQDGPWSLWAVKRSCAVGGSGHFASVYGFTIIY